MGSAQNYPGNLPANHAAIAYSGEVDDSASRFLRRLASGTDKLDAGARQLPFLRSLLHSLDIDPASQVLVFSKTSVQSALVSPSTPRAIYFNDTTAVAFVPGAQALEVAAIDAVKGAVFYRLDRSDPAHPYLKRRESCLLCHQGPATLGVPGLFVGSVFPNPEGQPLGSGSIITDHRTAFAERWGGWYVNAKSGKPPDRSNAVAMNPDDPEALEAFVPAFQPARYLTPFSDIVALMTFEHQTHISSLITRLTWEALLDSSGPKPAEIEDFVAYMLFADEAKLREPLAGVSPFASTFPLRGPSDTAGRSLRQFDLQSRLFRYRLSYMVFSPAFDAMPPRLREQIYRRLYAILSGQDQSEKFSYLPNKERRAILEILRDTKKDLPHYWSAPSQ